RLYRGSSRGVIADVKTMKTTVPTSARMVQMGDFNDDAVPDLGYIDAGGLFWLLPGTGTGGYGSAVQIGNGWNMYSLVSGAVDFDGDGHSDVIARDDSGALFFYRGNGSGGWASGATQIGTNWHAITAIIPAGDFDGDRKADILARTSNGILMLYPTDGAGSWLTPRQVGNGWNAMNA